jgi:hypothetical protein
MYRARDRTRVSSHTDLPQRQAPPHKPLNHERSSDNSSRLRYVMRDRHSASHPSHQHPSHDESVHRHARAAPPVTSNVAAARDIAQSRSYDKPADIASRLRIAEYEKARVKANAPPILSRPTKKRAFDDVDEDDATSKTGLLARDVLGLRLDVEDMAAHEEELKREREQRRAAVEALLSRESALKTMQVIVVHQEPVAVVVPQESVAIEPKSSDAELPQTQSADQNQEYMPSIPNAEQMEVITKTTQKDKAAHDTFRDSACFLEADDPDAGDEHTDFDADTDINDECFTPADKISTTDTDSQVIPTQPVQLPGQSKGKGKKLFLEPGDEGFVQPSNDNVIEHSGEQFDGMLGTFTADLDVPLGASTTSKPGPTIAINLPLIAGDADEGDEDLQKALLESLQPTSRSDGVEPPQHATNDSDGNTKTKEAVRNKLVDDKTFGQADDLGGLASFLAYDSAEDSEDDDSGDEAKKNAPPIYIPRKLFEEKLKEVIADLMERYQACRIAYMPLDTIDIKSHLGQFSQTQRHGHVKAFVKDNIDHFARYKPVVVLRTGSDDKTRGYKSLSAAWHDTGKRIELCGALKWIFALLKPSRPDVEAEDAFMLKPKMSDLQEVERKL